MALFSRDLRAAARLLVLAALVAPILAACGGSNVPNVKRAAFTSKEFGVAVSPRVTNAKNPPKGGGRYLVGKPYTVRGEVYEPLENPIGYVASGGASWYGNDFHGRMTANGEIFSANGISCASPVLPLPSYVRVTNLENGRSVVCRVNDRGPYLHDRVMDVSYRTAEILGYANKGVGQIQVQYIGPAPLQGDDTRMLLASVDRLTAMEMQGETRLAMLDPSQPVAVSGGRISLVELGGAAPADRPDVLGDFMENLFGYAESGAAAADINSAHAAANAMATRADALQPWVASIDEDKRAIRLELGVFPDSEAQEVAVRFAFLGAVDAEAVRIPGADATRLILTHLKPGVARSDVLVLARELGLNDLVLY